MPLSLDLSLLTFRELDGLTHNIDRHLTSKPPRASAFEQFMRFPDASQRKHRANHRLDQAAFDQVGQRVELASVLPEALAALLQEAARRYAANPSAGGCLVLQGTRCNDHGAREAARAFNLAGERMIRDYIAERHPNGAERVADYVATIMSGLSAKARNGHGLEQLLATARLASLAIRQALES